jgi:hypothetical protein
MRTLALLLTFFALLLAPAARADSVVLGGGCFWCLDAAYKLLPGVTHITCGYAGGTTRNPTYEDVCSETTGHAEVVKDQLGQRPKLFLVVARSDPGRRTGERHGGSIPLDHPLCR